MKILFGSLCYPFPPALIFVSAFMNYCKKAEMNFILFLKLNLSLCNYIILTTVSLPQWTDHKATVSSLNYQKTGDKRAVKVSWFPPIPLSFFYVIYWKPTIS